MNNLTINDILRTIQKDVSVQDYSPGKKIDGVQVVDIKRFVGGDGTFEELMRIDTLVQGFKGFELKQINRSRVLPGSIKAWHLHFAQEDIWYVDPEDHLLLGLWDLRESSATKDVRQKLILGAGYSRLVYIPRGVAHGVANVSQSTGTVMYFINQQFSLENPDERRLPWDAAGADFWTVERG